MLKTGKELEVSVRFRENIIGQNRVNTGVLQQREIEKNGEEEAPKNKNSREREK